MTIWQNPTGLQINYELYGKESEKPALLLLPGLLGAISSQWRQFITPLTATHRVILVDYRGHGRSSHAGGPLNPEGMVEDIFGLLDYLGLSAVHIAGYSLGGYLGLMAAAQQPRRIATLLLLSTRYYWSPEGVEKFRQQVDPDFLSQNAPHYANQLAQEHGASRWRALARETADLIATISQKGLTEGTLGRLQTPVLVCVGDRDEIVSLPESTRLARLLPQAGLLVLPHTHRPLANLPLIPLLPMMQKFHQPKS